MSNRARLILLSGTDGPATASVARATAEAAADEGVHALLIDGMAPDPDPGAVDLLTSSLGRVFADLGADPVHVDMWSSLPGVAHLATLNRIMAALADPSLDAVLVDCGDIRRARELVDFPQVALRLLDALLTPRLAMLRGSARGWPAGEADDQQHATAFEAMSSLRSAIVRMQRALADPHSTARLVTTADEAAVSCILDAVSVFSLLGVGVDGVAVVGFPRKDDGWPRAFVDRQNEQVRRLRDGCAGTAVWKSGPRARPVPKDRSVLGPLGRVHVLDVEQLTVRVGDEDLELDLPLVGPAIGASAVGRRGDDLVVAFEGVRRWLPLPPVLRRCRPSHAERTDAGLTVTFVPDDALWRQPAGASS